MILIDLEKQLKTYGGSQTLRIAGEFASGSITKVYGPSGSGKTTFLKMLAGLIKPEKGTITVGGTTWLDMGKKINLPPQKRQTGFVFQDYALFPNMTVLQHLQYATTDTGWIKRLLATGRLETLANHKPQYLSGGQQQRLAILRALAIKPCLLLMDEPFAALDERTKTSLITGLSALFEELKATVFIVSHNLHELKAFTGEQLYIGQEEE